MKSNKYMLVIFALTILVGSLFINFVNAKDNDVVFTSDSNPLIMHNRDTCIGKVILSKGDAFMDSKQCLELIRVNNQNVVLINEFT